MNSSHNLRRIIIAAFGLVASRFGCAQPPDCVWDNALNSLKSMSQSPVLAAVVFDDGTGPALYVGGNFNISTGDEPLFGIAKWNGRQWISVGGGVTASSGAGVVAALVVHNDGLGGDPALYVGGDFTHAGNVPANNIAKWDGDSWSALGDGSSFDVNALLSSGVLGGPNVLIAGGNFTTSAGSSRVAKWDGREWSIVGVLNSGAVKTFEVFHDGANDHLYVGGFFGIGSTQAGVAKWTGTSWQAVGESFSYGSLSTPSVYELQSFNDGSGDYLYAGGAFTKIGDTECWNIARWNGQQWMPMGLGFDGTIETFAIFDDGSGSGPQLLAGGYTDSFLTDVNTWTHAHGVARWNGLAWSSVGGGVSGSQFRPNVSQLLVLLDVSASPKLLVCGDFFNAGEKPADGLGLWDGISWAQFAPPLLQTNSTISSMCFYDDGLSDSPSLYAAGRFRYSGSDRLNYIARWDGADWHAVGSGPFSYSNIAILALNVADLGSGPELFAGGQFDSIDGVETENIARWNGKQWNAIPGDFPDFSVPNPNSASHVRSLTFTDDPALGGPAVFVTGRFATISGQTFNSIALWNGKTWVPLSSGLHNGPSTGLGKDVVVLDDGSSASLYVCGSFDKVGGIASKNLGRWDGASWMSATSGSPTHIIEQLTTFNNGTQSKLVASAQFNNPLNANGVGILDNGDWTLIGTSSDSSVNLRIIEHKGSPGQASNLYVGGSFKTINDVPIKNLGKWDGMQWSEVAGGTPKSVDSIAVAPDQSLYVGLSAFESDGTSFLPSINRLTCTTFPGDIAPLGGNGTVDVDDLLTIINAWGECDDRLYCPSDIAPPGPPAGDGVVGIEDLLVVIEGWS